ncbi:hypothetical protein PM082_013593 [Marasmius tenuissimus]|nr:hypothetical protein PM082_013593 [Marasmius tenuissimus]
MTPSAEDYNMATLLLTREEFREIEIQSYHIRRTIEIVHMSIVNNKEWNNNIPGSNFSPRIQHGAHQRLGRSAWFCWCYSNESPV